MARMGSRIEADTSSKRPGETWKGVSNESGGAIQADQPNAGRIVVGDGENLLQSTQSS
jgi:hypothetical protein